MLLCKKYSNILKASYFVLLKNFHFQQVEDFSNKAFLFKIFSFLAQNLCLVVVVNENIWVTFRQKKYHLIITGVTDWKTKLLSSLKCCCRDSMSCGLGALVSQLYGFLGSNSFARASVSLLFCGRRLIFHT